MPAREDSYLDDAAHHLSLRLTIDVIEGTAVRTCVLGRSKRIFITISWVGDLVTLDLNCLLLLCNLILELLCSSLLVDTAHSQSHRRGPRSTSCL